MAAAAQASTKFDLQGNEYFQWKKRVLSSNLILIMTVPSFDEIRCFCCFERHAPLEAWT